MMDKFKINMIEKIAKAIILLSLFITMSFFILVLYSEFTGKHLSIGGNYLIISLLVNIGFFVLILISVHELIKNIKKFLKNKNH